MIDETRNHVAIEQELDWYFNHSACEVGHSSNFFAMVDMALSGKRCEPSIEPDDAQLIAAARQRRVRSALQRLDAPLRAVIRAAHHHDARGHGVVAVMLRLEIHDRDTALDLLRHAHAAYTSSIIEETR